MKTDGNMHQFVFRKKFNEPVSQIIQYISSVRPELKVEETHEKFTFNERFNHLPFKIKLAYFLVIFAILFISFYAYFTSVFGLFHSNDGVITLKEYNKCEAGMSYKNVVKIIGAEGEPVSDVSGEAIQLKTYCWYGDDIIGTNATITFENDKLISKAQIGLE